MLAVNSPAFNKIGTVGRFLPFVEPRLEPVPGIDEGGRLIVGGPNVMIGYYRADNPGELEPTPGGWHDTGDIVAIDEEGFVAIKGRAKRLVKIAGETVSLASVEDLVTDLSPTISPQRSRRYRSQAGRARDLGDVETGRDAGRGSKPG